MAGTLQELVYKTYKDYVKAADIDPELKRRLGVGPGAEPRVPLMLNNLIGDLARCGPNIKRETIEQAVRDVTKWQIQLLAIKAQQMIMSRNEKNRLLEEQKKKAQLEKDVETYDEKGAMHVLKTSETFEEERRQIGLRSSDYEEGGAGSSR